jgi:hypothetical protein
MFGEFMLGTAACVTGFDPCKMNRLFNTAVMKDEVIVARSQCNFYDDAVRRRRTGVRPSGWTVSGCSRAADAGTLDDSVSFGNKTTQICEQSQRYYQRCC